MDSASVPPQFIKGKEKWDPRTRSELEKVYHLSWCFDGKPHLPVATMTSEGIVELGCSLCGIVLQEDAHVVRDEGIEVGNYYQTPRNLAGGRIGVSDKKVMFDLRGAQYDRAKESVDDFEDDLSDLGIGRLSTEEEQLEVIGNENTIAPAMINHVNSANLHERKSKLETIKDQARIHLTKIIEREPDYRASAVDWQYFSEMAIRKFESLLDDVVNGYLRARDPKFKKNPNDPKDLGEVRWVILLSECWKHVKGSVKKRKQPEQVVRQRTSREEVISA